MVGALFPGSSVTDFRCAQQASAVASSTVFGDDLVRRFRAAACCHSDFHPLAFFALNTDLPDGFKTLGNIIIGRSLSAGSPKGQYGCWYSQHFHN
ncbi:hypothetical protein A2T76_12260 [Pseudomonas brenneri]|nr:hypothetical protein A2T76_12260 [Pseudomonas brenneri]